MFYHILAILQSHADEQQQQQWDEDHEIDDVEQGEQARDAPASRNGKQALLPVFCESGDEASALAVLKDSITPYLLPPPSTVLDPDASPSSIPLARSVS